MKNPYDPMEIFIKTINFEGNNKKQSGLEEGITKTAGTLDMFFDPIESAVRVQLENDKQKDDKTPILETVLQKVNAVTKTIVDNLSQNLKNENVSRLEIEFGLALKGNLKLYIFEAGSEQSIKFKITIEKQK
jgi:hypothetical protein